MATSIKTRIILSRAMEELKPFKRGNLWGRYWYQGEYGQLPEDYQLVLNRAYKTSFVYVVFSYKTPIAWRTDKEGSQWMIPPITYSSTTTHHQNLISVEVSTPGFWQRFEHMI